MPKVTSTGRETLASAGFQRYTSWSAFEEMSALIVFDTERMVEVGGVEPPSAMGSPAASTLIAVGIVLLPRAATSGNRQRGRQPYFLQHPRAWMLPARIVDATPLPRSRATVSRLQR